MVTCRGRGARYEAPVSACGHNLSVTPRNHHTGNHRLPATDRSTQIFRMISSATCVLLSGTQISRGCDIGASPAIGGTMRLETASASNSYFHTSAA